jgi:arsenite-transporting ATPase
VTAAASALDALLGRLPRATLVVGKGGVGKTTVAAGVAAAFAQRGEHTLVISTDPAAALGTVIGSPVLTTASPVAFGPNLDARQLDAPSLRTAFLDRWRDVIAEIVDRGTYLDRADVDGLVDAALPGADEIFGLLALAELLAATPPVYSRIVIDTAPTGHTLRLLALPGTFRALLSMLDTMQDKHRFMVRALTHRYRRDRADDFLAEMRARIDALRATLADGHSLAALVVTRDEPMVAAETDRLIEALETLHVRTAAVLVNATDHQVTQHRLLTTYRLPRTATPPQTLASIVELFSMLAAEDQEPIADRPSSIAHRASPIADRPSRIAHRALTIVGGKGGVGKTTVASALAIAAVDADGAATLLVSTDPAASLADAFAEPDADWGRADIEHSVPDAPGLVVRQMDAGAAFTRVRDEYQSRIDAVFERVVGRGLDVAHDRAVIRDLLALAPPGIDELFALSILGDALADGRFARIVVDPAPTGHLLRLLDMPAIALDWTHRLMRLMLKYRDVIELGDTAQELLDFARRTRALDALLHDPERCAAVIVALDEPVVRAETARLVAAIGERSIRVDTVLWNRAKETPAPLPDASAAQQLFAGEVAPPPTGVAALRTWSRSWTELSSQR